MSKRLTLQQLLFRDVGQNGMVTEVLPLDVREGCVGSAVPERGKAAASLLPPLSFFSFSTAP